MAETSGYSYNGTTCYGINWGADRVKGGDDIVYTSGNGTTLVDESRAIATGCVVMVPV